MVDRWLLIPMKKIHQKVPLPGTRVASGNKPGNKSTEAMVVVHVVFHSKTDFSSVPFSHGHQLTTIKASQEAATKFVNWALVTIMNWAFKLVLKNSCHDLLFKTIGIINSNSCISTTMYQQKCIHHNWQPIINSCIQPSSTAVSNHNRFSSTLGIFQWHLEAPGAPAAVSLHVNLLAALEGLHVICVDLCDARLQAVPPMGKQTW